MGCPGKTKMLDVTLIDSANIQTTAPMPSDTRLELGWEVGGGGGHSLDIREAFLYPQKIMKILTATLKPPSDVTLSTMAGEELTTISDVTAEEDENSRADKIRDAVRGLLGPRIGFKVIMRDTNE